MAELVFTAQGGLSEEEAYPRQVAAHPVLRSQEDPSREEEARTTSHCCCLLLGLVQWLAAGARLLLGFIQWLEVDLPALVKLG